MPTSSITYDAELGNLKTQTTYSDPAYGLADKTILDPDGINYQSSATYETPGTGYFRKLSSTTAGGSVTTYQHYGATETRANPCVAGSIAVSQAGFLKGKTEPSGIVTEVVYDNTGRIVASRIGSENWNCTTYDSRGRVSEQNIAANNGKTGRIIQYNYAYGGNPLKQMTVEVGGTSIYTESNFLGQLVKYIDASGSATTYSYDNLGRQYAKSSDIGQEEVTYDSYDRVTSKK